MRGVPLYGVLLGLEIEGTVEVGVAYFPALKEMLAAATGMGGGWNGHPAHVSEATDVSRGFLGCTDRGAVVRDGVVTVRWDAGACTS